MCTKLLARALSIESAVRGQIQKELLPDDKPTTTTHESARTSIGRFFFRMSATLEATQPAAHQEKKFGKTSRHVPHHTQKAKKWYPAEEEAQPKKVGLIQNARSLSYALLCAED
jgi:hypothetical protein